MTIHKEFKSYQILCFGYGFGNILLWRSLYRSRLERLEGQWTGLLGRLGQRLETAEKRRFLGHWRKYISFLQIVVTCF